MSEQNQQKTTDQMSSAGEIARAAAESEDGATNDVSSAAEDALDSARGAAETISDNVAQPPAMPNFDESEITGNNSDGIDLLNEVNLKVTVELGRTRMYVDDIVQLGGDSIVELDKAAGDPVDIYVNDQHIARGEVLVLNENFCVRVSEIINPVARQG